MKLRVLVLLGSTCLLGCPGEETCAPYELNEELDRCVCPGTTIPPDEDGSCPSDAGVDAHADVHMDVPQDSGDTSDVGTDTEPLDAPVDARPPCDSATTLCGVEQLCSGGAYNCARLDSRRVACWGDNRYGIVGSRSTLGDVVTTPTQIVSISGAAILADELYCGDTHVCLRNGQDILCWGNSFGGQVGNGTTDAVNEIPSFVLNRPAETLTSVFIAFDGTCATFDDGTTWCWGSNRGQQLGAGPTTGPQPQMVRAPELDGADEITGGTDHICHRRGSSLRCAGWNSEGQLGDGTNDSSPVTVAVDVLGGATRVFGGGLSTCAIGTDNRVYCWGWAVTGNRNIPTVVAVPEGATQLRVSYYHVCAMVDGRPWCWGTNTSGQLGDGTASPRDAPVLVSVVDPSEVVDISIGWDHSCALMTNGSVRCWGDGERGALGNGRDVDSLSAVQVVARPR